MSVVTQHCVTAEIDNLLSYLVHLSNLSQFDSITDTWSGGEMQFAVPAQNTLSFLRQCTHDYPASEISHEPAELSDRQRHVNMST